MEGSKNESTIFCQLGLWQFFNGFLQCTKQVFYLPFRISKVKERFLIQHSRLFSV